MTRWVTTSSYLMVLKVKSSNEYQRWQHIALSQFFDVLEAAAFEAKARRSRGQACYGQQILSSSCRLSSTTASLTLSSFSSPVLFFFLLPPLPYLSFPNPDFPSREARPIAVKSLAGPGIAKPPNILKELLLVLCLI